MQVRLPHQRTDPLRRTVRATAKAAPANDATGAIAIDPTSGAGRMVLRADRVESGPPPDRVLSSHRH